MVNSKAFFFVKMNVMSFIFWSNVRLKVALSVVSIACLTVMFKPEVREKNSWLRNSEEKMRNEKVVNSPQTSNRSKQKSRD